MPADVGDNWLASLKYYYCRYRKSFWLQSGWLGCWASKFTCCCYCFRDTWLDSSLASDLFSFTSIFFLC